MRGLFSPSRQLSLAPPFRAGSGRPLRCCSRPWSFPQTRLSFLRSLGLLRGSSPCFSMLVSPHFFFFSLLSPQIFLHFVFPGRRLPIGAQPHGCRLFFLRLSGFSAAFFYWPSFVNEPRSSGDFAIPSPLGGELDAPLSLFFDSQPQPFLFCLRV